MKTHKIVIDGFIDTKTIELCTRLFGPAGTKIERRWFYRCRTKTVKYCNECKKLGNVKYCSDLYVSNTVLYFRKESDITLLKLHM